MRVLCRHIFFLKGSRPHKKEVGLWLDRKGGGVAQFEKWGRELLELTRGLFLLTLLAPLAYAETSPLAVKQKMGGKEK